MYDFHQRIAALRLAAATLDALIGQVEELHRDGYRQDAERLITLSVAEVDRHLEGVRPTPSGSPSSDVLPF